ncbi:P-loop containing nucleoside triphosphate hydrolase protein [Rhizophagus irregularis DAOM 181602=DAOM 197198]|nr:P-loop containing nucleoside triphosphate hydrolase protein [Rhizophagus irregularis DAOM 181602=DAOM 197198]
METWPDVNLSKEMLVSRPEIIERLKKILQPHKDQPYYHVISGEHGTGKTTLIASKEVGLYIDVPSNLNELGQLMQKFKPNDSESKISKWEIAVRFLNHASVVYKAKHNFLRRHQKKILMKVEDKMRAAKLLKNYQHYEVGKIVIDALLKSKELRQENVVTFQSRSVEVYVQEYSINEVKSQSHCAKHQEFGCHCRIGDPWNNNYTFLREIVIGVLSSNRYLANQTISLSLTWTGISTSNWTKNWTLFDLLGIIKSENFQQ